MAVDGRAGLHRVVRDISGEIEAKEKLYQEIVDSRQQKDVLQNILDTMPSGLLQCTFERIPKVTLINKTGANILGFADENAFFAQKEIRDNVLRCIHPADRELVMDEIFGVTEEGIVKSVSHRIVTGDGQEKWVRAASCVIQNMQGKKIYQVIFYDVTEIKTLRRKNDQWDMMERSALYTAITSAYPMIILEI